MSDNKKERFSRWKERHESLWQFIMFALVGCVTSVVDLGSFALFNFWIFTPYRQQAFSWWLIDYSLENGGMTAFLAFACSNAISQTFNFFLQRKATFKATNNVAKSAVMYVIMVLLVYVLQLYLPTLIRVPVVGVFGDVVGDILVKMSTMTLSFVITFPLNKWVIMRKVWVYAPEYLLEDNLERLKKRSLGKKRNLVLNEFALGMESLDRFVCSEPLYRVHECVFGVLALESEPVDPGL